MLGIVVDYFYRGFLGFLERIDGEGCAHRARLRVNRFVSRKSRHTNSSSVPASVPFAWLILYDFDNFPRRRGIDRSAPDVIEPFEPASKKAIESINQNSHHRSFINFMKLFTFEPIELQTSSKRVLNSNGRQLQILF